jgi:hypothetical protein
MKNISALLISVVFANTATAATVAVTDLAYSNTVEGYIHTIDYHNDSHLAASSSSKSAASGYMGATERGYGAIAADGYGGGAAVGGYSGAAVAGYSASASAKSKVNASSNTDYHEYEHSYSYVEYGELRKFTGDIKGELIKSRNFQLVQSKPAPIARDESVYNIIARIKKGSFPNADYVLFGRVSEMNFNDSVYQVSSSMNNQILGLTLVAEFSLINTKTYEVIASFTSTGEGQDTKILTPGTYAVPNRALVVARVSKSLGEDVLKQIDSQVFDNVPSGRINSGNEQAAPLDPEIPIKPQGVVVFQ